MPRRTTLLLVLITLGPLLSNCLLELKLSHIQKGESNYAGRSLTAKELTEGSLRLDKANDLFTVPLTLGTPSQSFNVLLDTGSFILWVSSTTAHNDFPLQNTFNPSASTTIVPSKKKFQMQYVTGRAKGEYTFDVASFFTKTTPLILGLAEETFFRLKCDGILGMSHQYNPGSGFSEDMSLMHQLKKNKVITQNIFSIQRDEFNDENSMLFIGGYHEDFNDREHVASCKLTNSQLWMCPTSHMVVTTFSEGKTRRNLIGCHANAIIDTGSNRIIAPSDTKEAVKKLLPSSCQFNCHNADFCALVCSEIQAAPDFSLVFNGKSFKMSKRGLYSYYPQKKVYISKINFSKNDKMNDFILGMPFFYNMHVAFDNENQQMKFYSKSIQDLNEALLIDDNAQTYSPWVIALIAIESALLIGGLLLLVFCLRKKKRDNGNEHDVNTVIQYVSNNVQELILSRNKIILC